MNKFGMRKLLTKAFVPALVGGAVYFIFGLFCYRIPHILLFCLLALVTVIPIELGAIIKASKEEFGESSLKSALLGCEDNSTKSTVIYTAVLFIYSVLVYSFVAPMELELFENARNTVVDTLRSGFDWMNTDYVATFSKTMILFTFLIYFIVYVVLKPVIEELYFRGYLSKHYEKENILNPIMIAVLYSVSNIWLPFHNIFRLFIFIPVTIVVYKKKNVCIGILYRCLCNFVAFIAFCVAVIEMW